MELHLEMMLQSPGKALSAVCVWGIERCKNVAHYILKWIKKEWKWIETHKRGEFQPIHFITLIWKDRKSGLFYHYYDKGKNFIYIKLY